MSTAYTGPKQNLGFWQIWNMCFGFFGIQFGWSLQMGNMSAIYEFLGAKPEEIPALWLAAPMTGLLVQPLWVILVTEPGIQHWEGVDLSFW
jgi:maltose/moltooligosaccharide transporter